MRRCRCRENTRRDGLLGHGIRRSLPLSGESVVTVFTSPSGIRRRKPRQHRTRQQVKSQALIALTFIDEQTTVSRSLTYLLTYDKPRLARIRRSGVWRDAVVQDGRRAFADSVRPIRGDGRTGIGNRFRLSLIQPVG